MRPLNQAKILYILLSAIFIFAIYCAYAYDLPKWFPFNEKNALTEWQEKIFKGKVLYTVKPDDPTGYLKAQSKGACSGLIYKIKFNAQQLPMISWQWKINQFPGKNKAEPATASSSGWLEKDDYAARVYVIFPSWNFMNIRSLEYIWDETLAEGTIVTSTYSANIKLIVVQSGKNGTSDWVAEERNIAEDYKMAFGKGSSLSVGAIALMTDADNTISTAEAEYKDIKVGYKK